MDQKQNSYVEYSPSNTPKQAEKTGTIQNQERFILLAPQSGNKIASPYYMSITQLRELKQDSASRNLQPSKSQEDIESTQNAKFKTNIPGKLANSIIKAGENKERENPVYKEV